ncbi:winged helix-turn-helix domain-containing protein [Streptomyces sp. NPDC048696]|uniref:winged helix-turn-helix domain-containing protein n=1 Tax=Streptomyces sp. NPDC048696 TaxID=3365585 RepID=UPI00371524D0
MPLTYRRAHHLHPDYQNGTSPQPPHAPQPAPGLVVDRDRRTVTVSGRPLDLPYLQFELLAHLLAHPHRVHTRGQLMNTVWDKPPIGDLRTVDVHIARLRRALGPAHAAAITTVRRVGYTYVPELAGPRAS